MTDFYRVIKQISTTSGVDSVSYVFNKYKDLENLSGSIEKVKTGSSVEVLEDLQAKEERLAAELRVLQGAISAIQQIESEELEYLDIEI